METSIKTSRYCQALLHHFSESINTITLIAKVRQFRLLRQWYWNTCALPTKKWNAAWSVCAHVHVCVNYIELMKQNWQATQQKRPWHSLTVQTYQFSWRYFNKKQVPTQMILILVCTFLWTYQRQNSNTVC